MWLCSKGRCTFCGTLCKARRPCGASFWQLARRTGRSACVLRRSQRFPPVRRTRRRIRWSCCWRALTGRALRRRRCWWRVSFSCWRLWLRRAACPQARRWMCRLLSWGRLCAPRCSAKWVRGARSTRLTCCGRCREFFRRRLALRSSLSLATIARGWRRVRRATLLRWLCCLLGLMPSGTRSTHWRSSPLRKCGCRVRWPFWPRWSLFLGRRPTRFLRWPCPARPCLLLSCDEACGALCTMWPPLHWRCCPTLPLRLYRPWTLSFGWCACRWPSLSRLFPMGLLCTGRLLLHPSPQCPQVTVRPTQCQREWISQWLLLTPRP